MKTMIVQVSDSTKAKLDALRAEGFTLSGYIRSVLARALADEPLVGAHVNDGRPYEARRRVQAHTPRRRPTR